LPLIIGNWKGVLIVEATGICFDKGTPLLFLETIKQTKFDR